MNKRRLQWLIQIFTIGVFLAATYEQLRRPPAERTWHGRVMGFVPYDFRVPTLERIRETYWNPDNPNIFTDRVLGVGWGINFYQVWRMLQAALRPAAS